jgi:hypothetical protein
LNPVQQQLLPTGTHFEPTGSDAAGPQLEVCDACRMDVTWAPGRCRTPEVHRWKDPGFEPGEDSAEALR